MSLSRFNHLPPGEKLRLCVHQPGVAGEGGFLDYLSSVTNRVSTRTPRTIVDICCGAGAGAILLARRFPACRFLALDLNSKVLSVGIMNARFARTQVIFVESDLFSAMKSQDDIDLIVSNPP